MGVVYPGFTLLKVGNCECPGMSGQNTVAMVNSTVEYECASNFCVVNVLAQQ